MVPRSSVEYLSRPRKRTFTSPVILSPLRIQTESVFCAPATAAPDVRHRPARHRRTSVRERDASARLRTPPAGAMRSVNPRWVRNRIPKQLLVGSTAQQVNLRYVVA